MQQMVKVFDDSTNKHKLLLIKNQNGFCVIMSKKLKYLLVDLLLVM